MAIQFPNFLGVPVRTPDYSAVGDIFENYYKGRAMPKDDLIKAIQAEFARPLAEQSLLSSRLSNRRSQMELNKMAREAEEQAQFENLLRQSMSGKLPVASPQTQQPAPIDMPVNMPTTAPLPINPMAEKIRAVLAQQTPDVASQEPMQGFDPSKMDKRFVPVDRAATGLPASAYKPKPEVTSVGVPMPQTQADNVPQQNVPQQTQSDEIVLQQGAPHLAGIDQLWDARPEMHKYLEARGYKKTQETKMDKNGKVTIKTVYPSGTITLKTIGGKQALDDESIPLTTKSLNDAVKQVRATDAIIPYIDELIRMGSNDEMPMTYFLPTDAQAQYHRVANEALDKYIVATGLNATDKSLDTVKDILFRSFGESTDNWIKGLQKARANKLRERAANVKMINQGLKKSVNFDAPTANVNDNDPAGVMGSE